ncbi:MAG: serine hydrolase domain-containing protein, partial [Cyclobacteriaceae bacterium]
MTEAQNSEQDLRSAVAQFVEESGVPAIAASIIFEGKIIYGLSGVKKIGSPDPIDKSSKFQLASNTKAITATVAAGLVSDGLISWDSKLIEVLPELQESMNEGYLQVTLEDLLSHRSFVAPFEEESSSEWRGMPLSIRDAENQKLAFAQYALIVAPSQKIKGSHLYSNGGYIIAALMMQKVSGKSWETLVEEFLSELSAQGYCGFPNQESSSGTYGHKKKGKTFRSIAANQEVQLGGYFSPAGNFSIGIEDFSKFVQAHLQGLLGAGKILSSEMYRKMHYGLDDYSLGWYNGFIGDSNERFSYHGGSLGSYSSAVMLSPDRRVGIVILINADGKRVTEMKNDLRVTLWDRFKNE